MQPPPKTDPLKSLLKSIILLETNRFKKETGQNLPNWQDKLREYEKAGGYFVHFSDLPKMSLFIRNKYKTPIGFYVYPLDQSKIKNFALERPYALVIKPKPEARLLNTRTYSKQDLAQDTQTLVGLGYPNTSFKGAASRASPKTPAGVIWNVTRFLSGASRLGKQDQSKLPKKGGGPTGTWTMLLRKLGYDGVVDEGDGIIHDNEPAQAVFFDTTKLELVELIEKPKGGASASDLFVRNYSNKALNGANFSNRDLQGAVFFDTDLFGASFINSNLMEAVFTKAGLNKADFSGANLKRAYFSMAHLKEAVLVRADLAEAVLNDAVLAKANLSETNLSEATLNDANLSNANLSNANLDKASLFGTNLKGANLSRANLKGAKYSPETILPDGFDPDAAGMIKPPYFWDNEE